jgi:uncharacterized protein
VTVARSIPLKVRASTAVERQAHFSGELAIDGLSRLTEALASPEGSLQVDLQLGRWSGSPAVRGTVTGEVVLSCRQCRCSFRQPLDCRVDLRLVYSDAEELQVLRDCEPCRVQDDELLLRELVEDEALLALPMLPRCDSCENASPDVSGVHADEASRAGVADGPFAVLKTLKIDGRH